MKKKLASLIAGALFLLLGCAVPGPKLANSAEDIAGIWHSTVSSLEIQFNEDGTGSARTGSGEPIDGEFRFEKTQLIWKTLNRQNDCVLMEAETGIYEVEMLENGNLKFTAIEDECTTRVAYLEGALLEAEFEPIP